MSEREQFEAWARSVGWPHYATMPVTKGPDFFSDLSWDVWQAARAQPAQAVPLTDAEIDDASFHASNEEELSSPYRIGYYAGARWAEAAVRAKLGVAVPMTPEQIKPHAEACMVDDHLDFVAGIRIAERHHGIVGEKGGT